MQHGLNTDLYNTQTHIHPFSPKILSRVLGSIAMLRVAARLASQLRMWF
jgi:hypothetical protein